MIRFGHIAILIICLLGLCANAFAVERFPPPDFETGYEFPETTTPPPRSDFREYADVVVLLAALALATWLTYTKRSRRGLFVLMIFSALYFGFYRKGCICSIGAIQNVVLTIFDSSYAIPPTAIAFFLLPLIFALFVGRVFCAAVCPLGALQDVVLLKPISVPRWLESTLR
ncbi:MAG: 4Fe-4S binding protein, partial [Planctomycetes bacterium]|nr:4Fe-4S binding protein [Planctomycetota bacterium]